MKSTKPQRWCATETVRCPRCGASANATIEAEARGRKGRKRGVVFTTIDIDRTCFCLLSFDERQLLEQAGLDAATIDAQHGYGGGHFDSEDE